MNDRKTYIINVKEQNYFANLTRDQIRLMDWLNENDLLYEDLEYLAVADIEADTP